MTNLATQVSKRDGWGKTLREESNPFGDVCGQHSTRKSWFMVSGKGAVWVRWSLESYSWN